VKPIILLDIDGVVANFAKPVVDEINRVAGTYHRVDQIRDWDIYGSLGVSQEVADAVDRWISSPYFCAGLEPYPDALAGIEELRGFAHVIACTSPWKSRSWMHERVEWLETYARFDRSDIIFTHRKDLVFGHALVDDKVSTLKKWREGSCGGEAIVFRQPWNEVEMETLREDNGYLGPGYWAAFDWKSLVGLLRVILPEDL
jgi:5'(3')-deoxyribonucleotidase